MSHQWQFDGRNGRIVARIWSHENPRYLAVLAHGYGEHIGRYEYVASALRDHGAAVYGPDHQGHGRSEGERVVVNDFENVIDDMHTVVGKAVADHPDVPIVLIGHSLGGMVAARYAQRYGATLAALVLSGPVLGSWEPATSLLDLDEIPDNPIDVSTLSRDPEVGEAYNADPLIWHGPFKRPLLAAVDRCLKNINASGSLGALPTLWLHGEADQLVPPGPSRDGVDTIAGSRLTSRMYPDARHEIFNETNKDEVLGDVTAFIDRVLP